MIKQTFNLVVPMAGRGSRFKQQGYANSKPFINVNGKPMIQKVLENLQIDFDKNFKTVIIAQQHDFNNYDFSIFRKIVGHDNVVIKTLKTTTEGAACTLLTAKEYINTQTPMLSINTDQLIDYNVEDTFKKLELADGGIPCFYGEGNLWSYAKVDEKGFVVEVAEKKQISNNATAGYYFWKHGSDFVKYAEQMIEANDRVNNEFYVAPVYNYAVKDCKKIIITKVDKLYSLGTPEHLREYINSSHE